MEPRGSLCCIDQHCGQDQVGVPKYQVPSRCHRSRYAPGDISHLKETEREKKGLLGCCSCVGCAPADPFGAFACTKTDIHVRLGYLQRGLLVTDAAGPIGREADGIESRYWQVWEMHASYRGILEVGFA